MGRPAKALIVSKRSVGSNPTLSARVEPRAAAAARGSNVFRPLAALDQIFLWRRPEMLQFDDAPCRHFVTKPCDCSYGGRTFRPLNACRAFPLGGVRWS